MEGLTVSGFTMAEGGGESPKFPPTRVMNDYIAGYLAATLHGPEVAAAIVARRALLAREATAAESASDRPDGPDGPRGDDVRP